MSDVGVGHAFARMADEKVAAMEKLADEKTMAVVREAVEKALKALGDEWWAGNGWLSGSVAGWVKNTIQDIGFAFNREMRLMRDKSLETMQADRQAFAEGLRNVMHKWTNILSQQADTYRHIIHNDLHADVLVVELRRVAREAIQYEMGAALRAERQRKKRKKAKKR